ncbi:MAG: S1 RNA-binding domain-containing protein [Candidatus Korarchaeota archaeon]|nr:S1 RNA-binding domain-containing protein [Candidatus Korarchaeota archaeon]NIU83621.1 S1 RNA-binding domain-containing protein [Candidatus Thorarchaeota archaeon]NIW14129.1 S1 RNA-binding domain-containing protein [Candidatus Thorarchaeota archaeon]NIW52236.1 S1 RNA-binding domain-containing protein [Candidatus Korarchaeota archaeon]
METKEMQLPEFWRKLYQEEVREGMLVLGRVKRIEEHGVYIDLNLLEAEAYCPVKELSSRRVTTPKDIVKQGQRVVGKIYRVRRGGRVLSISLKRISHKEREEQREEWRKLSRSFSTFKELSDKLSMTMEDLIELLGKPLSQYFPTVFDGLKEIVIEGKGLLKELDIPEEYVDTIYATLQSAIKVTKRELKREVILKTLAPNGIEKIKDALQKAKDVSPDDIKIKYLSAPRYKVIVKAFRWKDASKKFGEFKERLERYIGTLPSEWQTQMEVKEGKR